MEPKRACCGSNFPRVPPSNGNQRQAASYRSPVRNPTDSCSSRRCRYGKPQIQGDPYSTQKLLDKIQYLRKSIQDLETAQQQPKSRSVEKKDAPCQTAELTPSDIYNIRDIVNSCITEMTKLKEFLDDENCWWKIFKRREFNCCEQKLPHLHGFLDGTMVTLKMLEETLQPGKDFVTSTPIRTPTFESKRKPDDPLASKPGEPATDRERDGAKKYVDAAANTRRSIDFVGVKPDDAPSPQKCHMSCGAHVQGAPAPGSMNGTADETSYYHRPFRPEDLRRHSRDREQTFYSLPDGSEANDVYLSKGSIDFGESSAQQQRPELTFSSENMARRSVLAKDMSTSMDVLPPSTLDSTANLQDTTERSFSLNTSRSYPRDRSPRVKKQAQQK